MSSMSLARWIGLVKSAEDGCRLFRGHPDAGVNDIELQGRDRLGDMPDDKSNASGLGELERVPDEVQQNLAQRIRDNRQVRADMIEPVRFVLRGRWSVHARRGILARTTIRFVRPRQIEVVVEGDESPLRRWLRRIPYPLLFRGHALEVQRLRPVSLQRFPDSTPASLHRLPLGRGSLLLRYDQALRGDPSLGLGRRHVNRAFATP